MDKILPGNTDTYEAIFSGNLKMMIRIEVINFIFKIKG